ncbi:hypothetical protein T492DRAFT_909762 [Pavlovales sp. CCMP2436]|nr:hypothetical protein T492DRAFT_909762 [Pavlovales sp. CCMP2436]
MASRDVLRAIMGPVNPEAVVGMDLRHLVDLGAEGHDQLLGGVDAFRRRVEASGAAGLALARDYAELSPRWAEVHDAWDAFSRAEHTRGVGATARLLAALLEAASAEPEPAGVGAAVRSAGAPGARVRARELWQQCGAELVLQLGSGKVALVGPALLLLRALVRAHVPLAAAIVASIDGEKLRLGKLQTVAEAAAAKGVENKGKGEEKGKGKGEGKGKGVKGKALAAEAPDAKRSRADGEAGKPCVAAAATAADAALTPMAAAVASGSGFMGVSASDALAGLVSELFEAAATDGNLARELASEKLRPLTQRALLAAEQLSAGALAQLALAVDTHAVRNRAVPVKAKLSLLAPAALLALAAVHDRDADALVGARVDADSDGGARAKSARAVGALLEAFCTLVGQAAAKQTADTAQMAAFAAQAAASTQPAGRGRRSGVSGPLGALLRFCCALRPAARPAHASWVCAAIGARERIATSYFAAAPLALEPPRLATSWLCALALLNRLAAHAAAAAAAETGALGGGLGGGVAAARCVLAAGLSRAVVSRGLQHKSALVRLSVCQTLCLVAAHLTADAASASAAIREAAGAEARQLLPDGQILLALRQKAAEAEASSCVAGSPRASHVHALLHARALALLRALAALWPSAFADLSFDARKLLLGPTPQTPDAVTGNEVAGEAQGLRGGLGAMSACVQYETLRVVTVAAVSSQVDRRWFGASAAAGGGGGGEEGGALEAVFALLSSSRKGGGGGQSYGGASGAARGLVEGAAQTLTLGLLAAAGGFESSGCTLAAPPALYLGPHPLAAAGARAHAAGAESEISIWVGGLVPAAVPVLRWLVACAAERAAPLGQRARAASARAQGWHEAVGSIHSQASPDTLGGCALSEVATAAIFHADRLYSAFCARAIATETARAPSGGSGGGRAGGRAARAAALAAAYVNGCLVRLAHRTRAGPAVLAAALVGARAEHAVTLATALRANDELATAAARARRARFEAMLAPTCVHLAAVCGSLATVAGEGELLAEGACEGAEEVQAMWRLLRASAGSAHAAAAADQRASAQDDGGRAGARLLAMAAAHAPPSTDAAAHEDDAAEHGAGMLSFGLSVGQSVALLSFDEGLACAAFGTCSTLRRTGAGSDSSPADSGDDGAADSAGEGGGGGGDGLCLSSPAVVGALLCTLRAQLCAALSAPAAGAGGGGDGDGARAREAGQLGAAGLAAPADASANGCGLGSVRAPLASAHVAAHVRAAADAVSRELAAALDAARGGGGDSAAAGAALSRGCAALSACGLLAAELAGVLGADAAAAHTTEPESPRYALRAHEAAVALRTLLGGGSLLGRGAALALRGGGQAGGGGAPLAGAAALAAASAALDALLGVTAALALAWPRAALLPDTHTVAAAGEGGGRAKAGAGGAHAPLGGTDDDEVDALAGFSRACAQLAGSPAAGGSGGSGSASAELATAFIELCAPLAADATAALRAAARAHAPADTMGGVGAVLPRKRPRAAPDTAAKRGDGPPALTAGTVRAACALAPLLPTATLLRTVALIVRSDKLGGAGEGALAVERALPLLLDAVAAAQGDDGAREARGAGGCWWEAEEEEVEAPGEGIAGGQHESALDALWRGLLHLVCRGRAALQHARLANAALGLIGIARNAFGARLALPPAPRVGAAEWELLLCSGGALGVVRRRALIGRLAVASELHRQLIGALLQRPPFVSVGGALRAGDGEAWRRAVEGLAAAEAQVAAETAHINAEGGPDGGAELALGGDGSGGGDGGAWLLGVCMALRPLFRSAAAYEVTPAGRGFGDGCARALDAAWAALGAAATLAELGGLARRPPADRRSTAAPARAREAAAASAAARALGLAALLARARPLRRKVLVSLRAALHASRAADSARAVYSTRVAALVGGLGASARASAKALAGAARGGAAEAAAHAWLCEAVEAGAEVAVALCARLYAPLAAEDWPAAANGKGAAMGTDDWPRLTRACSALLADWLLSSAALLLPALAVPRSAAAAALGARARSAATPTPRLPLPASTARALTAARESARAALRALGAPAAPLVGSAQHGAALGAAPAVARLACVWLGEGAGGECAACARELVEAWGVVPGAMAAALALEPPTRATTAADAPRAAGVAEAATAAAAAKAWDVHAAQAAAVGAWLELSACALAPDAAAAEGGKGAKGKGKAAGADPLRLPTPLVLAACCARAAHTRTLARALARLQLGAAANSAPFLSADPVAVARLAAIASAAGGGGRGGDLAAEEALESAACAPALTAAEAAATVRAIAAALASGSAGGAQPVAADAPPADALSTLPAAALAWLCEAADGCVLPACLGGADVARDADGVRRAPRHGSVAVASVASVARRARARGAASRAVAVGGSESESDIESCAGSDGESDLSECLSESAAESDANDGDGVPGSAYESAWWGARTTATVSGGGGGGGGGGWHGGGGSGGGNGAAWRALDFGVLLLCARALLRSSEHDSTAAAGNGWLGLCCVAASSHHANVRALGFGGIGCALRRLEGRPIAAFAAAAARVLVKPRHPLYARLNRELLNRPWLDATELPSFLTLFHGAGAAAPAERAWMAAHVLLPGTRASGASAARAATALRVELHLTGGGAAAAAVEPTAKGVAVRAAEARAQAAAEGCSAELAGLYCRRHAVEALLSHLASPLSGAGVRVAAGGDEPAALGALPDATTRARVWGALLGLLADARTATTLVRQRALLPWLHAAVGEAAALPAHAGTLALARCAENGSALRLLLRAFGGGGARDRAAAVCARELGAHWPQLGLLLAAHEAAALALAERAAATSWAAAEPRAVRALLAAVARLRARVHAAPAVVAESAAAAAGVVGACAATRALLRPAALLRLVTAAAAADRAVAATGARVVAEGEREGECVLALAGRAVRSLPPSRTRDEARTDARARGQLGCWLLTRAAGARRGAADKLSAAVEWMRAHVLAGAADADADADGEADAEADAEVASALAIALAVLPALRQPGGSRAADAVAGARRALTRASLLFLARRAARRDRVHYGGGAGARAALEGQVLRTVVPLLLDGARGTGRGAHAAGTAQWAEAALASLCEGLLCKSSTAAAGRSTLAALAAATEAGEEAVGELSGRISRALAAIETLP